MERKGRKKWSSTGRQKKNKKNRSPVAPGSIKVWEKKRKWDSSRTTGSKKKKNNEIRGGKGDTCKYKAGQTIRLRVPINTKKNPGKSHLP